MTEFRSCACILALVLVLVPSVAAPCPPEKTATSPGELMTNLNAALHGDPCQYYKYQNHLDWSFNHWKSGGSLNLPLVAHAIELVRNPNKGPSIDWWKKLLTCQTAPGQCQVPSPGKLTFFKGNELLSDIYDFAVVDAVLTVNWWAHVNPSGADLQILARSYLRKNWCLYTMAAGSTWAEWLADDVANDGSPTGNGCGQHVIKCNRTSNNLLFFTGPFLALAGQRSKPGTRPCYDDRAVLFAYAIEWNDGAFTNLKEHPEQAGIRTYLQGHWPGNAYNESVFALNAGERTLVKDQIYGADQIPVLAGVLNNGATRFWVPMHFLGWSDGTRASFLEYHDNNNPGGTLYASKFEPAAQRAQVHYPWWVSRNGPYRQYDFGYARVTCNVAPPACGYPTGAGRQLETWNDITSDCSSNPNDCKHPTRTLWMSLPSAPKLYEVVIDPSGARRTF
ncbi:MAG: hypothetical protein U0166_15195 [Acidobacteriota bacterium]